ncbi:MAG: TadE/TadG family type IV pilus assembly protein [Actinomycetota bacterium]
MGGTDAGGTGDRERGQVFAEFAIAVPLLVVLVFGVVHLSIAMSIQQGVHAAAREGARVGSVTGGDACAAAKGSLGDLPDGGATCSVISACPGEDSIVEVRTTYVLDIPLMPSSFQPNLDLSSRAEFRCER